MAFGILIKGPLIVMIAGLAIVALAITDRSAAWLSRLKPAFGLVWMLALVLPWFIAIILKSGDSFFVEAVGNGGWAGTISYPAMAQALARGYATTSTDTGHSTPGGSFALGHPEKLIDFAYRSEHEMTVEGKAIVKSLYGNAPKYSYWNGCSTGERQGLKEAQRYPSDYDGIIAGAPANYWTTGARRSSTSSRSCRPTTAARCSS